MPLVDGSGSSAKGADDDMGREATFTEHGHSSSVGTASVIHAVGDADCSSSASASAAKIHIVLSSASLSHLSVHQPSAAMEVESAECECCKLKEDCTQGYIVGVKADFGGRWLCGLCSEAVRDEVAKVSKRGGGGMEEALTDHMSFCGKCRKNDNPAFRVADGMRQMLRRISK